MLDSTLRIRIRLNDATIIIRTNHENCLTVPSDVNERAGGMEGGGDESRNKLTGDRCVVQKKKILPRDAANALSMFVTQLVTHSV